LGHDPVKSKKTRLMETGTLGLHGKRGDIPRGGRGTIQWKVPGKVNSERNGQVDVGGISPPKGGGKPTARGQTFLKREVQGNGTKKRVPGKKGRDL